MSKYNIQAASKLTGVGIHTLRAWENRYGAVRPERTEKGRRLYSNQDIEKLQLLSELCINGRSISTIANLSIEQLKAEVQKLSPQSTSRKSPAMLSSSNLSLQQVDSQDYLNKLLLALDHYKLDIISHELSKLRNVMPARQFAIEIITPLLKNVGKQVLNNDLTIAQEHALSSVLKFHIGHIIYNALTQKPRKTKTITFATPENEHHEFGILISAILAVHHGVRFFYFGPNMPKESLVHASKSMKSDIIVLGTSHNTGGEDIQFLNDYIDYLLQKMGPSQQLWLGGQGAFDLARFHKDLRFHYISTLEFLDSQLEKLD